MQLFGSGPRLEVPNGDPARQAVAALRGYAYQLYVSALAWLALSDGEILHLEIAEDYAIATREALTGAQVRDTKGSGGITLQSDCARSTIDSYVDLVMRNPGRVVSLHYLTTSAIGLERERAHRVNGAPALDYWRRAAMGADLGPLRGLIENLDLTEATSTYLASLSDDAFRTEFLQRIHWHCGAPGLADLRADLEAGVIEYVASARQLSSQTARSVMPIVLERILMTAVSEGARALRRADLLLLIDEAALVAVPIEQLASAFQAGMPARAITRTQLLTPVDDLPVPTVRASRNALVAAVDAARCACGLAIASGATGLGKSLAARMVAARTGTPWSVVDFRYLSPAETASRLNHLRGEIAASTTRDIILDDLNGLDDPMVRDALASLLSGLRRRDATAIVTTYRSPANTTLQQLAPEAAAPVEVPYLDQEEVAELVVQTGGDPKYARAVYRATANGHPQMTMAALLHLRGRQWSRHALAVVFGRQLHSELGAERRAVRERLVSALPVDAQTLLFRTSLLRGGFDRRLALAIASLDPAVPRGGLVLDQLIGPWIEPFRRSRFRVSPMLENAADEVLSTEECRAIHRCVAEAIMMGGDEMDAVDAGVAMHHALRSEGTDLVVGFAHSVITCDVEMIDAIAPFLTDLMYFPVDVPIFPSSLSASAMMRLAQLLVLLPYSSADQANAALRALEAEWLDMQGVALFEAFALSKLLLHPRASELFPDWLELLLRFDQIYLAEPRITEVNSRFTSKAGGTPHVTGVLFAGQLRSIKTIASFRTIIERLDREDPATRERLLSSFQPGRGDISVFVNHGWMRESGSENFDWEAAQRDYGVAFEIAMQWENKMLASRCAIAQAMCIDENGNDPDRALAYLSQVEARIGCNVVLGRARAKIHWRRRDHAAALPLLTAAAEAGGQDAIEHAFIAREAGISAATLNDWEAARQWFERAHVAAASASELPSVRAMAIGLLADTAQAAFKAGRPDISILKMRDALTTLPKIDAEGAIAEAHCHRVVRHGLLWLHQQITGVLDDEETIYLPGAASNPEPLDAIRSHPVVALDISFYLLAAADEALDEPTGFYRAFRDHLVVGPVLSLEISATIADDRKAINMHDPTDFVARVRRHASMAGMVSSGEAHEYAADVVNPRRGTIPLVSIDENALEDHIRFAEDYLLSFAIGAAMAREFGAIDSIVEQGLAAPEVSALHPLLRRMVGDISALTSDREGAASSIWTIREGLSGRPVEFCWTAVWLLIHASNTRLRDGVVEPLMTWIFAGADHLVRKARFLLSSPVTTAPPVEKILVVPERSMASAARLLLALSPAVGTRLIPKVRDRLESIIETDLEATVQRAKKDKP